MRCLIDWPCLSALALLAIAVPGCAGVSDSSDSDATGSLHHDVTADVCSIPTTISDFRVSGAIGNKWNVATQTLAYGRVRANGYFATYLSDVDGRSSQRVSYAGWRNDRHQFPAAWYPDGRYLVVAVEKAQHPGNSVSATPGYGAYTDYWLVTRDGHQAWKLVDLPNDAAHAVTHAAFSPDGSKFIWTERIKAPDIFSLNRFVGSYEFNLATFVDRPTPHLTDIRSFIPGGGDQGEKLNQSRRTIKQLHSGARMSRITCLPRVSTQ